MCTEYQTNHDKYSMQLIADVLQKMINNKNITKDNLYTLSEEDIFKILKEKDKELYNKVLNTGKIIGTNVKPNKYYVSIKTKKMYTIPLVKQKNGNIRITDIDPKYQKQLEEALAFESDEYRYKIEIIKHNTEILKARNDKSKLYHALNNKEIWLRCLQDEVGKGSKKSSRYEDLM